MKYIEERIETKAAAKIVFQAWANKYLPQGFEKGQKGFVVNEKKKGIKFKIEDFLENEYLNVVWFSHLVKLKFFHKVEKISTGSLIICRVELKGFFAFLIKPLIAKGIRKNLQTSLRQFARDLEDR